MPADLVLRPLASLARAAAGLVLPVRCAGCDGPGAGWCPDCRAAVRGPAPPPRATGADGPRVWSAVGFDGPVRRAVTAYKDDDRRDAGAPLSLLLAQALTRSLAEDDTARGHLVRGRPPLVVPVPTSAAARRRRGDDPVGALAMRAAAGVDPGLRVLAALRHTRRVADQTALGRVERRDNVRGSLVVPPPLTGVVAGHVVVLVDDVVTTGATLAEAARALRSAEAAHVVAATVASTGSRP